MAVTSFAADSSTPSCAPVCLWVMISARRPLTATGPPSRQQRSHHSAYLDAPSSSLHLIQCPEPCSRLPAQTLGALSKRLSVVGVLGQIKPSTLVLSLRQSESWRFGVLSLTCSVKCLNLSRPAGRMHKGVKAVLHHSIARLLQCQYWTVCSCTRAAHRAPCLGTPHFQRAALRSQQILTASFVCNNWCYTCSLATVAFHTYETRVSLRQMLILNCDK